MIRVAGYECDPEPWVIGVAAPVRSVVCEGQLCLTTDLPFGAKVLNTHQCERGVKR